MKKNKHQQQLTAGRLTVLSLALTAALAAMAPLAAQATPTCNNTPISSSITSQVTWSTGDCTVTSTGVINVTSTTALLATGSMNGTLTNSGTISGNSGIYISGTIDTLTNSGTISGTYDAIDNSGTITTLTNNSGGVISGRTAIVNFGTIDTLTNSGTISGGSTGIYNTGTITTLINNGTISGVYDAIDNSGTITTLNNSGIISGGDTGIYSYGTIGILTNSGAISGVYAGIDNNGTITTLNNSGTISGGSTGIFNNGTIGILTNSGTISGASNAIVNYGSLGPITNSGVIAGNIYSASANDLNINGGTGTIFGTLTGFSAGSIGAITNTASNVTFGSGNLLLNDNINVGSNAVNNIGTAVLQVNQPITITGNYNQGAGATLQIGVASGATTLGAITDTGYGRLVVNGNSTIAAGSSVTLQSNGYAFAAGQRYVVIDTTGTATYNESSLHYSINGYTSTVTGADMLNGSNHDLVLNLVSATPIATSSPAAIASAPNAVASLNGLLNYNVTSNLDPALNNLRNAMLGSLSQGSAATANQIGKQLAPTQPTAAAAAPTTDALNVVGGHVDALRVAQAGGSGVATGEGAPQTGVWSQVYGGHAGQSQIGQVDGYNANYGGLLIGADKALNDNWRAGGVFTYSNTAVNSTGDTTGDTARINSYGLIGYASYTGSPWYVNLSGAVMDQQYDTTRQVNFQGFSGTANGQFSGRQYVARAEAGYPLALGGVTLTPLASLTYSYQNQGSYTESGGNGAALAVDAAHADSVKSGLGAKLEKSFSTHYGEIVPELQLQWIHEYDHTAQVTGASFAADPTGLTAFTTVGAVPVSNLADLSLGVTLLKANNLSLSARYELQAARGFVSQTGTVRLRQLF
ncbi:MAG: putative hemagglutinin-related autotransporter protein [Herbaspirillum sp.]|nr:putative hemagglutinin-related autotransporter protein [Herbaspirillum sp.]